ncbi:hypothetical protein [Streptacidiphilus rugosus]|uniref:hypothetical protein n=1 Tax=Streptacidiphilus rugosus TaxID=405783 RepID=UPI0005608839|nr:hypothetical protein [Streptacidiphilus rugosus]
MLVATALIIYASVALWTARCVFARQRAVFVARRAEGRPDAAAEGLFRRQERDQAKAIALLVGASWPVSAPLLLARRLITMAVLRPAPPTGKSGGAAERQRQRQIRQLEQELGLSRVAEPDPLAG